MSLVDTWVKVDLPVGVIVDSCLPTDKHPNWHICLSMAIETVTTLTSQFALMNNGIFRGCVDFMTSS